MENIFFYSAASIAVTLSVNVLIFLIRT